MHEYWLFGYGSLIFKPPPHVVERVPGHIKGAVRRFWQMSSDHRGTIDAPGRVVTLITREYWQTLYDPHPYGHDGVVHGVAFRIDPKYAAEVKVYMDDREKCGYEDIFVDFYPADSTKYGLDNVWKCITYVGEPSNEAFGGPQEPEALAKLIASSVGASGSNIEYLTNLDRAVLDLTGARDRHLEDLVTRAEKYLHPV